MNFCFNSNYPSLLGHKIFSDHELEFYRGVASTFGSAYAKVVLKNRMAKLLRHAVEWLGARSVAIEDANVYVVQSLGAGVPLGGGLVASSDKDSVKSAVNVGSRDR